MPHLYFTLLTIICAFAFWKGGREERIVAITSILATAITMALTGAVDQRYVGLEFGVMLVDLVVLAIYVSIALLSDRFWPLWVAGLQLTTSFSHGAKAINLDLMPTAYAVAAQFWVYPILIILFVATWRRAARRSADARSLVGPDPGAT